VPSGGTLIAVATDQIVMAPSAVLGPVDPQLGGSARSLDPRGGGAEGQEQYERQDAHHGRHSRKAIGQVEENVTDLLREKLGDDRAHDVARTLSDGR
jgi:ClpP class serine protease